jgi:hypothetical protein
VIGRQASLFVVARFEFVTEGVSIMNRTERRKTLARVSLTWLAALVVACAAFADEHPKGPEHPADQACTPVNPEALARAIQGYVSQDAKLKGGYFLVYDDPAKRTLALTLLNVHKDRLSKVADQAYFACADFRTPDGKKVYDLDLFMTGPDAEHLAATQVLIHKEDGAERYSWYEENGIWKRRPAQKP